jgi:hypothetical protein
VVTSQWTTIAQAATPVWAELDRSERLRVLAALGLVLALGGLVMWLAWWGARATRRYMHRVSRADQWAAAARSAGGPSPTPATGPTAAPDRKE